VALARQRQICPSFPNSDRAMHSPPQSPPQSGRNRGALAPAITRAIAPRAPRGALGPARKIGVPGTAAWFSAPRMALRPPSHTLRR